MKRALIWWGINLGMLLALHQGWMVLFTIVFVVNLSLTVLSAMIMRTVQKLAPEKMHAAFSRMRRSVPLQIAVGMDTLFVLVLANMGYHMLAVLHVVQATLELWMFHTALKAHADGDPGKSHSF